MHKPVWRKTPAREAKYKERMRENTIKLSAKEELITEAIVLATLQTIFYIQQNNSTINSIHNIYWEGLTIQILFHY